MWIAAMLLCCFLNQCCRKDGTQYHGSYAAFNHYMMCELNDFDVSDFRGGESKKHFM
jgi:hypothetical protein